MLSDVDGGMGDGVSKGCCLIMVVYKKVISAIEKPRNDAFEVSVVGVQFIMLFNYDYSGNQTQHFHHSCSRTIFRRRFLTW